MSNECDLLRKAMGLLHSPHSSSATELRLMLDEMIKQRYGLEKTITTTLNKRHLDEELTFPGRLPTPPPPQRKLDDDEIINLTHSPAKTISDSPDTIIDSEDAISGVGVGGDTLLSGGGEDDGNLRDFGDLNCCVCGEMMFTATNRLIECSKCGTLYHQECHKPPITDEEASEDHEHNWQCNNCCNKPTGNKSTPEIVVIPDDPLPLLTKIKSPATSSRSSSSSNSSSSFFKQDPTGATSSQASTKSHHKKSSSRPQKEDQSSSSSSKASVVIPTINVRSAPEKSSSHSSSSSSKKSSSHSSSSRSSSSKSSRHHESSSNSSRRKGK